jgi:polyhydroxyalkanoate synthase
VAARLADASSVHLLGYCLGGTMTTMHIARRPEYIQSHVAIASPVSFEDTGILGAWTRSPHFNVHSLVDALGNMPAPLLQAAFYLIKPTLLPWKVVSFLDRAHDESFVEGFMATEHWGSDNIPFAGEAFRGLIQRLYRDDALMQGRMSLSDRPIALEDIECPTAIVTFEHDYIVPTSCAVPLLERISSTDTEHIHVSGGHVGAVVSRRARNGLWPRLSSWWSQHEGGARSLNRGGLRSV